MPSIRDDKGYNQGYKPSKSLEVRNRRRCAYMTDNMDTGRASSILELGCGTGELAAMLAKNTGKKVLGVDICAPFIIEAKKRHKLKDLEFKTLDFNDKKSVMKTIGKRKFDYIVGNGILHHLYYNLDASLKNIHGLLNKGGKAIFQEPNFFNPYCLIIFNIPVFRKTARLEPGEMTFTRGFIRRKLARAGFNDINVEYRDFLVPGVPDFMIGPSVAIGDVVEKVPVLNMLAQSIYITAKK